MYCHRVFKSINCNICHLQFETIPALRIHTKRTHNDVQYYENMDTCVICNTVFTNKNKFKTHINKHTNAEKVRLVFF